MINQDFLHQIRHSAFSFGFDNVVYQNHKDKSWLPQDVQTYVSDKPIEAQDLSVIYGCESTLYIYSYICYDGLYRLDYKAVRYADVV